MNVMKIQELVESKLTTSASAAQRTENCLRYAGYLQIEVKEGDCERNILCCEQELSQLQPAPQSLIVLPEMWATGFVYPKLKQFGAMLPQLLGTMQGWAAQYSSVIAGSLVEPILQDGKNQFYNSLFLVDSSGVIGRYRKQRLFTGWEEEVYFTAGETSEPVQTNYGNIGCLICFDLRFPELARIQCQKGADILICSAMWPSVRIHHWNILLQARAIENQIFVIGCNAIGISGNSQLGGNSVIYSPDGTVLVRSRQEIGSQYVEIDWSIQKKVREKFNTVDR